MGNGVLGNLIGDNVKVTVNVEFDNDSIKRLCVGLLIVGTILILIGGIVKKLNK
jgi:hypothetical protein